MSDEERKRIGIFILTAAVGFLPWYLGMSWWVTLLIVMGSLVRAAYGRGHQNQLVVIGDEPISTG